MGVALLSIYVLVFVVMMCRTKQSNMSVDDFFVNGYQSSTLATAASILSSCIGASATIGIIGLAFYVGMPAFWWLGSGALGLLILGYTLAVRVRSTKIHTLSTIITMLMGSKAELLASIIIVLAWTSIVAAQLSASVFLIYGLLGIDKLPALLISCALIAMHTIKSGQGGIIQLDKLQASIIVCGILAIFIWCLAYNPSISPTISFELANQQFPLNKVIYYCLIIGGSYIVCPMLYGRVLSAKNEKTAKKGVLIAALMLIVMAIIIALIGIYARGLIPPSTPSDKVLTTLVAVTMPSWLAMFIYLFLLCAVVSSADSCLFAASSTLSCSLLKVNSINVNRLCTLGLMAIAVLLTFTNQSILDYLLMANNVYVCSIVIPVALCFICRRKATTINRTIMLIGMILACLCGLVSAFSDQYIIAYIGLSVSFISTIGSFIFTINTIKNIS